MSTDLEWENGCINDADVTGTVYDEGRIDDPAEILGHHGGSTDVVEVGAVYSKISPVARYCLPLGQRKEDLQVDLSHLAQLALDALREISRSPGVTSAVTKSENGAVSMNFRAILPLAICCCMS